RLTASVAGGPLPRVPRSGHARPRGSRRLCRVSRVRPFEPAVFDRFARAVPATHHAGLCLGLVIARSIVEAHGGSIEVQSESGAGATFTARLPLARVG